MTVENPKAGGDYYAQLWLYGFPSDGPASLTLSAAFEPAPLGADLEPNDGGSSALALNPADTVTGHLGYDGYTSEDGHDDKDGDSIAAPDGGALQATLHMAAASAINALVLYDPDEQSIAGEDIALPDDEVTIEQSELPAGHLLRQSA